MMVKRLISALLILLLVLTMQPFSGASAQETEGRQPVYVRVMGNTTRYIPVYVDNEDLLFSAQDLAELCAMELSWENAYIRFTRGSKTIKINTEDSTLYFMDNPKPISLPSPVYKQGQTCYISGAGVLPWLNVECAWMDSGYLSFTPNAVSFWDHAQTLNLDANMFRISDCAEILGMNTKDLKAIAYVEKNFSGTVTDYLGYLLSGEAGYYDYRAYHDIFEDIVIDKSPIDESYHIMEEAAETLSEGSGVLSYFLKAAGIDGDLVGTAITYYSIWTKVECYRMLLAQDNSVKLEMIDSITSNNKFSANSDMKKAARDVKKLCTDRSASFFKILEDLAVDALQDVTTSTLLKAVKEDWLHIPNDRVTMERMSYYSDMISLGRAIYSYGYGKATKQELTTYLSHAMMYLYAVEQSHYAMATYAADRGYDRQTLIEFWNRARDAEKKYSLILAMYGNLDADACDPRDKQKQSVDYYDLFASVDKIASHTEATRALENAIFVTALQEFAPDALWAQADLDADGQPEILVQDAQDYRPEQLVLDGYTMDYFHSATTPAGDYGVVKAGDDYLLYNATTDSYRRWNGSDWETADSVGFFAGSMSVSGDQALTCPDLTDQTIAGDTALLFDEIDTYFQNREDVWMQATQDLDGDGTDDRLVLLNGAANRYQQFLHFEGFEAGLFASSPLNYADRNVTLITATAQESGVRLRVCRIYMPYEYTSSMNPILRIDGRDLFIFGQQFRYREQGAPYGLTLSPEDPIAQEFLGIPRQEAEAKLTDYNEWTGMGYGTATGYYEGVHLQLTYDYTTEETYGSPLAKVTSVSIFGIYKSMPQLVPYGIYANMPVDEFYYQIPGISDWKPYPVMVTDYDGATMWYNENYYHNEFSGDIYLMRLYFREKKDNTPLVIMDAIWQEDMSIFDF